MRIEHFIEEVGAAAVERALGLAERAPALARPTVDPAHGDYQLNAAMPLAKKLGRPPRELAAPIAEVMAQHEAVASAEVAGPGFVNLRLDDAWIAAQLARCLEGGDRLGVPPVRRRQKTVIDFSSPNIAKQMHVGHLRSTIIGDSLVRLLRFVGQDVTSDNHLGDWGTQFGMLIAGMRHFGSEAALQASPVDELERVYKEASARAKVDPRFADEARHELAQLQAGNPERRALWEQFVATTRGTLDALYDRLGVRFDLWLGESAYHAQLAGVAQLLRDQGVARDDEGALCIFFSDHEGAPADLRNLDTPFIVQKKDGAYLYSTTDIATLLDRVRRLGAERILYVVDSRQALHFKQLFAVARLLGLETELEHVGFGTVLGPDGRPLKTREGGVVRLSDLLDEAEQRAVQRIGEQGLDIPAAQVAEVARIVGVGAVKYADLRQNRASDYRFDWDKMIAFSGNAGPYLQYAYARIGSIFRKGGLEPDTVTTASIFLREPAEQSLGRVLLRFGEVVHQAAESAEPHRLCDHLYQLARAFSGFYEACPVLQETAELRDSRLAIAALTSRQLRVGLGLLGIEVVERM